MFKTLISTIAFTFMLGVTSVSASSFAEIAAGSYKLYRDGQAVCSSQFIDKKTYTLVTAEHCVTGADENTEFAIVTEILDANLNVIDTNIYKLQLLKTDPNADVATLRLLPSVKKGVKSYPQDIQVVDVATVEEIKSLLTVGQEVMTSSYPLTESLTFTNGMYTGLVKKNPLSDVLFYLATPPLAPGSSGGGLYIKIGDEWKLFGIAVAVDRTSGQSFRNIFATLPNVLHVIEEDKRAEI